MALEISVTFPREVEDAVLDRLDRFIDALGEIPDVRAIATEDSFTIAHL